MLAHPDGDTQSEPVPMFSRRRGYGDLGGAGDFSIRGDAAGFLDAQVRDLVQQGQPDTDEPEGIGCRVGTAFEVQFRDPAVHRLHYGGFPSGFPVHRFIGQWIQGPERQADTVAALLVLPFPLHPFREVVVVHREHHFRIGHLGQLQGAVRGGDVHALMQAWKIPFEELVHPVTGDGEFFRSVQERALLLIQTRGQRDQVQRELVEIIGQFQLAWLSHGEEQAMARLPDDPGPVERDPAVAHDQVRVQLQGPVLVRTDTDLEPAGRPHGHLLTGALRDQGDTERLGTVQNRPQQGRGIALHV